jgi:hypothetical protein
LTGSELFLLTRGLLPGDTLRERLPLLTSPERLRSLLPAIPAQINELLGRAVAAVRPRFAGKISYASIPFEGVDWAPFDVISTDAGYRSIEVGDRYRGSIHAFVAQGKAQGKPAAITEFGCCTYRGAADRGGRGGEIVEWDGARAVRLDGDYVRDEAEQATYLREVLDASTPTGSTAPSRPRSRPTTCRTARTRATTWTWPATAWSRCWRGAAAPRTRTCRCSPRPPSTRSPTTTAPERAGAPRADAVTPAIGSQPGLACGSWSPLPSGPWGNAGEPGVYRRRSRLTRDAGETPDPPGTPRLAGQPCRTFQGRFELEIGRFWSCSTGT